MVLNPFLEGVIALLLGVGMTVVGKVYNLPDLGVTGNILIGTGVGYIARTGTAK